MNKIEGDTLTFDDASTYVISRVQNRAFLEEEHEDPTVRTEFEGGYVATRPRHTRTTLRRTWSSGFTDVSDSDKKQFEIFWNEMKGGSIAFEWVDMFDPAFIDTSDVSWDANINDALVRSVRFNVALKPVQKGHGPLLRWDIPFSMEEV